MNSIGKKSLIASAVAAVLGTSTAFAVVPTTNPTAVFYAAGGSAQANAFYVAACQLFGNNMDVYTEVSTGGASGSYYVMYGQVTGAALGSLAVGTPVMYIYKFNGGSFVNGIAPNLTSGATTLPYPTISSLLSTAKLATGATAGTACTTGTPTYTYTFTADPTNRAPDFGLSDVEPAMFRGFNNPTGNALGAAQNTNGGGAPSVGSATGIYDNLFGIAVTDNVFNSTTNPKKNFTRAEMAGIIAGTTSDWSQLYDDNGAQMPAGGIIFLDRQQGSGTKASGSNYFLGYPGDSPGATLPFSATSSYCGVSLSACSGGSNAEGAYDVGEASQGNVITDLKAAQAAGSRAIAIVGLEAPPHKNQVSGKNVFEFVKINGVGVDTGTTGDDINGPTATSYINAVKGGYDFFYQNSFNTRSGLSTQASANATAFKAKMSQNAFAGASSSKVFPLAVSGILIDANTETVLAPGVTTNSRNKISTGPLKPFFLAQPSGIPTSSDPL